MRHPDLDYMIVMERRRDDLAAAANSRLVKEARLANRLNAQVEQSYQPVRSLDWMALALARVLSFLGGRMITWSCRLQYRYAILSAGSAENSSSPCA